MTTAAAPARALALLLALPGAASAAWAGREPPADAPRTAAAAVTRARVETAEAGPPRGGDRKAGAGEEAPPSLLKAGRTAGTLLALGTLPPKDPAPVPADGQKKRGSGYGTGYEARMEAADRPDRIEARPERIERIERPSRPDRPERPARPERPERPDRR